MLCRGAKNFWKGFIWGEGWQFWKCTQFMRGVVQFLRQRIAILCIVNLLFNCFIIIEANPNFIQTKKSGWWFFPGKKLRPQAVQFFCLPSSDFCRTDSSNNKISFNLLIRWLFLNFTPFVMPAEIRQIIFVTLNHFFMLWISFFIFAIPCILSCSLLSSFEKWCPLTLHFLDFPFLHPFNKENKWPRVCKKTDKECVTVQ